MDVRFISATILVAMLFCCPLLGQVDNAGNTPPDVNGSNNGDQGWGPAPEQGNLRLRLTLQANTVKEGLPVLASLELKNFGENVAEYNWQSFSRVSVKHVGGDSDLYVASSRSTSGNSQSLQSGQSVFIWKDRDIGTEYLLDQGQYSVQVIGSRGLRRGAKDIPKSNIQTLKISKGQQTPRKRFMKSFISVAPKWWHVTYNSYGMSATYKYQLDKRPNSPKKPKSTGLFKVGPPQISFEFFSEPLPTDKPGKNLTALGKTEMGYMYVRSDEKIAELWADHIAKIREAAKSIKSGGKR